MPPLPLKLVLPAPQQLKGRRKWGSCDYTVNTLLLTVDLAPPESVLVLPPSTNPHTTDIIATAPPVPQMIASMRSDESATAVTRENTRMRTAIRRSRKAHAQGSHLLIRRPSDPRTEAVVTTTKKRTQSEAVTARTARTMTGAETMTRITEALGSDHNPQRLPSTAPADAPYPTLTPTPTATPKSTMTHPSHRESGAPTTKSTTTITANGSALAATTKTCPKTKNPAATAHPNPASATPKNPARTTTDLPKAPPTQQQQQRQRRNPPTRSRRRRNRHPKGRKSTSTPESARRGTRSGWRARSSGRRGRWPGRRAPRGSMGKVVVARARGGG